jgi:hypothetical protein
VFHLHVQGYLQMHEWRRAQWTPAERSRGRDRPGTERSWGATVEQPDTHAQGTAEAGAAADPQETAGPMAAIMAGMPEVWRRLLDAHVPDRLGRCSGCKSATGSGERWPCSLHRIASDAQRLHDQELTRSVDSD